MSNFDESIEAPDVDGLFTEQDLADLKALDADAEKPSFHPILQVWKELLSNADGELNAKVTPQWANRITSGYRELNFADMERFRDSLFGKVIELGKVLEAEIGKLEHPFESITTPEEDVEFYGAHYRQVLTDWQLTLLGWELDWECTSPDAAVELAAISEVHKMFFGPTGITQFLDNIKFEFTEADQQVLAAALEELKNSKEGR